MRNNIKSLRQEIRMSQTTLAREAKISRPYLSDIENGHVPSLIIASRIAGVLGKSIDDVFFAKMSYMVDKQPEEVS